MGNIVDSIKRFSSNDTTAIPVRRCSDLSIGISRLDRCTCIGNGISMTGETVSASKGGSINGCKDFCEEVTNEGMHMTPGSTSTKECLGDIDLLTIPMVHARPSRSGESNKERGTPNETFHGRKLGCVGHSEKSGLINSQTAGHMFHSLEDESTGTPRSLMLDISKDSLCKVSAEGNTNLADIVENSPAADAHRGKELVLNRISAADGLLDRNVGEDLADDALDSCYKSSTEVSLGGPRHEQRTQNESLNYGVVPIEVIAASASLDVSNRKSPLKGRAKRKSITKTSRRAKRKSITKTPSQTLVPKENTGTSVPSDLIFLEIEKQCTSPLVEQSSGDKVLLGTRRSRMSKAPLSVLQSPLTRSKLKAPSITTPDSVKMKRSRSGRVIVPRLDPGSQNIIYDRNHASASIFDDMYILPSGISSEPPSKRRSQRLSSEGVH
ncbi:hypothetical protein HU200_001327 [Digitaria exilis]|uniref:Uncharacterized protein n=1 Tax=Digitaria exilis TaxID=1010633 RepID=A0A835G085_9POAL|nr:hypothetical protein HU200_001327 [Digitaria exilis]